MGIEAGDGRADEPSTERVLIVGGGMAGSLLALVLGRAGHEVVLFDPRREPAPTFRCEKLDWRQIALLRRLGALGCFEAACWPAGAYPAEGRPSLTDCGAPHDRWIAQVRAAWPDNVRFVEAVVDRVETSSLLQQVETVTGERFSGRLVVLATGKGSPLRETLGVVAKPISLEHSVCIGFSLALGRPVAAQVSPVPHGRRVGYVSIFPMPGEIRVNLFSYRSLSDPWTRRMARDPLGGLAEIAPKAAALLDGARVLRRCEARGMDLHEVQGHRQDGVVLIGDAFHAPCPASGTGMLRILNDVAVLAETHLPLWLATPGMGRDKIEAFYADPAKRRLDQASLHRSLNGRSSTLGLNPYWRVRRRIGACARFASESASRAARAAATVLAAVPGLFG